MDVRDIFITLACLAMAPTIASVAQAQAVSSTGNSLSLPAIEASPVVLMECPVRPLFDVRVPVQVPGVLAEVKVKEGSVVHAGQTLARIDDRLAQMAYEKSKSESENGSTVMIALAKEEETAAQLADAKQLRGNIAKEEVRIKEAQYKIARNTVDDEKAKFEILKMQLRSDLLKVKLHEVLSPFDGVVIEQVRQQGEAVQALDQVFRVIRTDVVKVQGAVKIKDVERVKKGMPVVVYPNRTLSDRLTLPGHTEPVLAVKVLPDGKKCASAGADGMIILWDLATGAQQRTLAGHEGMVHGLAVSNADPTRLVSVGSDRKINVWKIDSEDPPTTITTQGGAILAVAFHPTDPNRIATGHEDRQVRIWNIENKTEEKVLHGHTNQVLSVAWTPDGKHLLSAGGDQTDRVWDVDEGKELRVFKGRSLTPVAQIGISPDGKSFLFDSYAYLQVVSLLDGRPGATIEHRAGGASGIATFSSDPQSPMVLTTKETGQLQLWQSPRLGELARLVRTYDGHIGAVNAVDFTPDARFLVSAGSDRVVRVWDVPDRAQVAKERVTGVVDFVNPQAEAGSQTLAVHAEVNNKDGVLQPGTFATMVIYSLPRAAATAVSN